MEYPNEKTGIFGRFTHLGVFFFSEFTLRFSTRDKISNVVAPNKTAFSKQKVLLLLLKGVFRAPITNYLTAECDRKINLDKLNEP